jgi:hypothetical protein
MPAGRPMDLIVLLKPTVRALTTKPDSPRAGSMTRCLCAVNVKRASSAVAIATALSPSCSVRISRAFRTAEIAFNERSVSIVREPRLRECDYGHDCAGCPGSGMVRTCPRTHPQRHRRRHAFSARPHLPMLPQSPESGMSDGRTVTWGTCRLSCSPIAMRSSSYRARESGSVTRGSR